MNRTVKRYLNFLLDLLLLISVLAVLISSYIIWFALPRGIGLHGEEAHCSGGGIGTVGNPHPIMGWPRYEWISFHNWASLALLAIVILHIILHWKWIIETTRRFISHIQGPARKILELYGSALILFTLFIFDCLSGLVLWLVMPRGVRDYNNMTSGIGRTFLGIERNIWVDLHAWVAVAILAIILIHVILNWDWVVGTTKKLLSRSKVTVN